MADYTDDEAQMLPDSEEEFTLSSEEECDSDEERLHFEERLDPAEDFFFDENVTASLSPSRATRTRRSCINTTKHQNKNMAPTRPGRGRRTYHSVFSTLENDKKSNNDNDQTPAAKRAKTDVKASNLQTTLSWKTESDVDMTPKTLRFLPAREPGPQLSPADVHTPQSLFKMFFPENAVSTLCRNTNAQAAKATANGCKYKWTDVSISEMYRYIGLLLYMNIVRLSSIRDYWRQDFFSVAFPAKVMSKGRFLTISWNFQMSHPEEDEENDRKRGTTEHDHLFRIKPLMDTIRMACKAMYHPKRNLVVEERIVPWKADPEIIQNMKAKPTRDFKMFVLADLSNGYTVDFSVYTGKNSSPTGHGLSYDVVTSLLDRTVLGSGYHVYMDDFFTSPKLLKDLFAMKFGACGTYRDSRKDCPRAATNSLTKKSARGSIRWIRDGPLVFVKWMDTREVSVCSTIHSAYTGETVQKKVKSQDTWKAKTFPCPAPVTAYDQHIHKRVHLSEDLLQCYSARHRTMKWYRKVFYNFLDIAATNAFIMHNELYGNMSHKEFLEGLIEDLCVFSKTETPERTADDHVPIPGGELTSNARTCMLCKEQGKRQDTPWKCKACDVHLCVQLNRNCFQKWHN
nr:piggyBac transposable element-derived protein 4-like [Misgurnus anguillicaudatus]